jgi:hypothetical protein
MMMKMVGGCGAQAVEQQRRRVARCSQDDRAAAISPEQDVAPDRLRRAIALETIPLPLKTV